MEYATAQFKLSKIDKATGKSRIKLFNEIYEQTGILAPELQNMPMLPFEARHLWDWFCDLGAARSVGFDLCPISWGDLWAFFNLRQIRPHNWELDALRRMDEAMLASRQDNKTNVVAGAKDLRGRLTGKAGATDYGG